jgi:restriction endonuclease S subunit
VVANSTFVISAGAAGEIGYSKVDFWAADDCFCFDCSENLLSRYLYYALLCKKEYIASRVRRASVPRLSRVAIEQLSIPVPPLDEQERIVDILDRFDTLTTDITSGLPAEIAARKRQYEYYRDKLFTFREKVA